MQIQHDLMAMQLGVANTVVTPIDENLEVKVSGS
jgi:hypothetical protein